METLTPEQKAQHESNKVVRQSLAWLHFKLGTQQFYLEEVEEAMKARGVLEIFCKDLQDKIELIEPRPALTKDELEKGPYIVDAPAVSLDV